MSQTASMEDVGNDIHRFARLSCALEAYAEILGGADVNASSPMGMTISLGLESIDPTLDIKEGSMITLKAIKKGLIAAAKAAREALRLLFRMLGSLYVKFTGSLGVVRGHQKRTAKALGRLGGRVTYKKMTISGINRLCINGQFVADDPQTLAAIAQVTDHVLNKHPKMVADVSRLISRRFLDLAERSEGKNNLDVAREGMEIFAQALSTTMSQPAGATVAQPRELPSAYKDAGTFHRSRVLPGNYALIYTDPSTVSQYVKTAQASSYAALIGSAFRIRFTELPLNTADRAERTVDVPSIQTLNALVKGISDILTIAERGESGMRDFNVVKVTVDDAIRQIAERSQNVANSSNVVLHMLGSISETLASPMDNFTHWVAVTLNVYLAYIDHCIKHYLDEGV